MNFKYEALIRNMYLDIRGDQDACAKNITKYFLFNGTTPRDKKFLYFQRHIKI